jgi:hypothetical protein
VLAEVGLEGNAGGAVPAVVVGAELGDGGEGGFGFDAVLEGKGFGGGEGGLGGGGEAGGGDGVEGEVAEGVLKAGDEVGEDLGLVVDVGVVAEGGVEDAGAGGFLFNPGDGEIVVLSFDLVGGAGVFGFGHVEAEHDAVGGAGVGAADLVDLVANPEALAAEGGDEGVGGFVEFNGDGVAGVPGVAVEDAADERLGFGPGGEVVGAGVDAGHAAAAGEEGEEGGAVGGVFELELGRVVEDDGVEAGEVGGLEGGHVGGEFGGVGAGGGAEAEEGLVAVGDGVVDEALGAVENEEATGAGGGGRGGGGEGGFDAGLFAGVEGFEDFGRGGGEGGGREEE